MRTREIAAVLNAIGRNKITRTEAARRLGSISERHVNRLMKAAGVTRPCSSGVEWRREQQRTARLRREAKERAARAVIGGTYDVLYASRTAGCSVRTLYRWVARIKKDSVSAKKRRKTTKK